MPTLITRRQAARDLFDKVNLNLTALSLLADRPVIVVFSFQKPGVVRIVKSSVQLWNVFRQRDAFEVNNLSPKVILTFAFRDHGEFTIQKAVLLRLILAD